MNKVFEKWFVAQFGDKTKVLLSRDGDGYTDQEVNAMFIGFNAGARLSEAALLG